ncbi:MAG: 1-deoxy-D-xylulose-5-phosphate synthase [Bacteroidales bacterium]|nr:1-deoxy-D-xylulose-5-phosphate synthase [Bacteroidales bacterium]
MDRILDSINSPADIKALNMDQLRQLCSELRSYMLEVCSEHPGHLASSLGAVELIVGLHYVYDAPKDKIIFDVGHQAYAHKILTGRKEAFKHLRTKEGVSGFPKMSESEYDAFGVGHASNSVSAALGYAEAFALQGSDAHSVALIGDGALSGGMAFEALNNAGTSKANILIVLNDNNQSIDKAIGGLHQSLFRVTSSGKYNTFKDRVWNRLGDRRLRRFIQRWLRSLKSWIVKRMGGDIFEALGLRYFGPISGNDIERVVSGLRKMKSIHGPVVLHCITSKGNGFAPAEDDPRIWHAPGKFDPETGERKVSQNKVDRFQDVFGEVLCELAEKDSRIVGVTPAMASGCGMNKFAASFPERFFDVGIEEEHAVTFSAGLAAGGMRPFCNIYSTFAQRAYDQIIHDVALQNLPVVLCFDRAGLVGEDGATHQGMFDLSAYRAIPNCVVSAPADGAELKNLMYSALRYEGGPYIIRYPRGAADPSDWRASGFEELPLGRAVECLKGDKVAVVAIGPAVHRSLEAAGQFEGRVGVYNFRFLKPLDTDMLDKIAKTYKKIITVEDGSLKGGLYGAVCEYLADKAPEVFVTGIGAPDVFIEHDTQIAQRERCGLDTEGISRKISEIL